MNEDRKKLLESSTEIIGELAIDSNLTDGFLREIPVVRSIWAFYKAGKSLQQHFYIRKIETFLENIQDIDESACKQFLNDAERNHEDFSHSLLLILDKLEDERKAILIAKTFKIYVEEKFSREIFDRLLLIINRGFYADLLKIIAFEGHDELVTDGNQIEPESLAELFSCGLLRDAGLDGGEFALSSGGTIYKLNKYGEIFLRVVKAID